MSPKNMVRIEQIAQAVLQKDSLLTRSLVQDFFQQNPRLADRPKPLVNDERILAISASLIELFAERLQQETRSGLKPLVPWLNRFSYSKRPSK